MRIPSLLVAILAVAGAMAACDRSALVKTPDPARQAVWSTVVASHTAGVVSRGSAVRIRFATDVAGGDADSGAGAHPAAAALLRIEPSVAGHAAFSGRRELVFTPAAQLAPGQVYRVQLLPTGLQGVPQDLPAYEFRFAVQTPQFEVGLQPLESDAADDRRMVLRGTLNAADVEDARQVEKLVRVDWLGKPVPLQWTHDGDGRAHRFAAPGLQRQASAQAVTVTWNGTSIGSSSVGEQRIDVPARSAFVVTEALAIDAGGRRQIQLSFSDSLGAQQSLRGLLRLAPEVDFTTRIDRNRLIVYPADELSGEVTVTIEPGIRNERGDALAERVVRDLAFASTKPQVRFVGKGVILPESAVLTIPFEAVSARSVRVTALRIQGDNVAQFLQVNALDGNAELGRVGRYLWRKTLPLSGPVTGRWQRYNLDVTELMQKFPGGMFQLTLQVTPRDSAWQCDGRASGAAETDAVVESGLKSQEDGDSWQSSNWDDYSNDFDPQSNDWRRRGDPCAAAYYRYGENVSASRNLLASDIGLLAKRDPRGRLLVAATRLRTAAALAGAQLSVRNFQNQEIGIGTTDATGLATITPNGTPFLLVAQSGGQRGYLRLAAGAALPVSHFDVGGEVVARGLKGYIYGERGVWRPGDTLHLTFVLQDREHTLPARHPVTLELYDPRGQLVQSTVNTAPVGGFYAFELKTDAAAPTGDWTAKALLGGAVFTRRVRIETVMPNRLRVALALGRQGLVPGAAVDGAVSAQWLAGGTAAGLKTDVQVRLTPAPTQFTTFRDYAFDDPARDFSADPQTVFEGVLDAQGEARFHHELRLGSPPPGMLAATFVTRVFERGGAFSIQREAAPYAPFRSFIGIRLPKGDVARDMLLTDREHVVQIASVGADGKPVALSKVRVTLYKVEWKWWWDQKGDSLAQYVRGESNAAIRSEIVSTTEGRGEWRFQVRYPEWGRYMVRACDEHGGHCTGRTFYIDWPSWAGKEREQGGPAASVLAVTSDKAEYRVGETATIQLPESAQGRALVTIESGTGILESRWLEPKAGHTRFTLPVTAAMTPNVYVAVTLVQPHEHKGNDRPLRLYGVIPLKVTDPSTRLAPVLQAADEWKPQSNARIEVAEAHGRAMTYTVAVVDEGLLSLTNFRTPSLHDEFYKREALGVTSWDLYDQVAGAYSAQLDRLLALGGSDAAPIGRPEASKTRFPPVVRVLGPFRLGAGAKATHRVDLPQYVGAVRVMVVAGDDTAYGSVEKSVYVRQPLMLLPTMPRVIGPGEDVAVPVSLFVTRPGIKDVTLTIEPDDFFAVVGERSVHVKFERPEEQLGVLHLRTAMKLGRSRVRFLATSGAFRAEGEIFIEVRSSNPATTRHERRMLQPGDSWSPTLLPHGIAGTNSATLEVSGLPALDLENRLRYLVQYPHGCLEQTTSSVFPQLYLGSLLKLEDDRKREIEDNIRAGIERLRHFQLAGGGFSYWPGGSGGFASGSLEGYEFWASTYASHFLIEAERAGYALPPTMRSGVIRHLQAAAASWSPPATLEQSYRLYVLALAGAPDVGAMNRLREVRNLPGPETWTLAAAYQLAGLADVATALTRDATLQVHESSQNDLTFGSGLRDRALLLHHLATLGRLDRSQDLVQAIAGSLGTEGWYSTQSVAYALMAMAKFAGSGSPATFTFERGVGAGPMENVSSTAPLYQVKLDAVPQAGLPIRLRNTSQRVLFATVSTRGVPAAGADLAGSAGLGLEIRYTDADDRPLDVTRLAQGTDLIAHVTVRNLTPLRIDHIALTQIVPAGWEIHNDRLDDAQATGARDPSAREREAGAIPDGSRTATQARVDYVDIRDDRVLQYFGLKSGESIQFSTRLNAAYLGRYYLPSVSAEAMYDATKNARSQGQWVQVVGGAR